MKKRVFTVEKTFVAQVKYYETLHVIRDENGQAVYTGTEEMAAKVLRLLKADRKKKIMRKPKRK